MIDFTNAELDLSANYGGSDKKRGIFYNNKRYMLKLSDRIPDDKRNVLNSSYTNSVFSEYICCHILEIIGLPVQKTLLGTISLKSRNKEERVYPVVACENFLRDAESLVEFKNMENSLLIDKPGKIPEIKDIYELMTTENEYFKDGFGEIALQRYWDTFIMDALFGNFDRHANNWGYLLDGKNNYIRLAPIYDCGSCLYPQICDDSIDAILSNPEEIQMRIDKFPLAALKDYDGRKVSYKDYIFSGKNPDCTEALLRIAPKINMAEIERVIRETPGITEKRKNFYLTMLSERYHQILLTSYEKFTKNTPLDISDKERE